MLKNVIVLKYGSRFIVMLKKQMNEVSSPTNYNPIRNRFLQIHVKFSKNQFFASNPS
jgi:hypothetical protein